MSTPTSPRYRFDHVGITVPVLNTAVTFFCDHLDAVVEFRLERFIDESGAAPLRLGASGDASFALAMLRIGDARVELLQWWVTSAGDLQPSGEASRGVPPHHTGSAHLAICVEDTALAYATLGSVPGVRQLGSPVTFTEGATPGLTNAFVETPWGLLLELMSWPR